MKPWCSNNNHFWRLFPVFGLLILGCGEEKPTIKRELYSPAPSEDNALWISASYIDGDLTRKEIHRTSSESDAYLNWQDRTSSDNGKTWSDFESLEQITQQLPEGGKVIYPGRYTYDPVLSIRYQISMRRLWPGEEMYTFNWETGEHPFNDHTFVLENGLERGLKFESGPGFDPENPFDSTYCVTNRAYLGQQVVVDKDGTAYLPMVCFPGGETGVINRGGVVLMRRDPGSGEWSASNQMYISPNISSRGLQEPDVAILRNGNLLIVCRGSNVKGRAHTVYSDSLQGRKWFLLSTDGGRTLSPVQEFQYDDGSRFYSPSSIHGFIRSSKNGKLYWLTNISPSIPDGGHPRYPLYIAEVDEEIPAVVKNSLFIIDDRMDNEPEKLQLSNFSTLENRETLDIEIYISRIGEIPDHFWQGAVYRYLFTPPN